jgi:aerobic-type carbon monoxide dehydrogenase small subunit (CoxS/CutS family)
MGGIPLSCRSENVMSDRVCFVCNGTAVEVDVATGESLLSVLRERLALASVKDGCAPQGQCGCCTVLVDGDARVACVTPAARVDGRVVTTVEGLDAATRADLAGAFVATGGSQCGFCTPGIVITMEAWLSENPDPSEAQIRDALSGNLCRCTGYHNIVAAVMKAAARRRKEPAQ